MNTCKWYGAAQGDKAQTGTTGVWGGERFERMRERRLAQMGAYPHPVACVGCFQGQHALVKLFQLSGSAAHVRPG